MRKAGISTALVAVLICPMLFADQIVMKNGDRLTGTIVKSDAKTLVIKTDYAGEVNVDWSAVQDMTSAQTLHVGLKNGRTVVGSVTTAQGKLEVGTQASGTVEAPKEDVASIRNDADQLAYEKSLHPGMLEGWNGGLNLGFAVTRGNSETKNLNIAFKAARKGLHDKLILYTNQIYATNDKPSPSQTTANAIGGGARYDHDLTPRVFGFVNGDFYHDALQFLDLRSTFGGGLGLHAIKSASTTLDLLAGANYTHESYGIPFNPPSLTKTRSLAGLTLGDDFMHKLGKSTVLTQSFFFYPDLSDTSQYRWTLNVGTVTKLNKWLGWQNSFGDVYVTNPPNVPGIKKNDMQIATGLNISFTH